MKNNLLISHGLFYVGTYGKFSYRGEILHMFDSYVYGNSEEEVRSELIQYLK